MFDQLANRWLFAQAAGSSNNYFQCVAISVDGEPTGSFYRYALATGNRFQYRPKYGVWPDAYYAGTTGFDYDVNSPNIGIFALNREDFLVGDATPRTRSLYVLPESTPYAIGDGLLPADLEGANLPPEGSPAYFMGSMDHGGPYGAPQDALTLWKSNIDWSNPRWSLTLTDTITVDPFDSIFPCTPTSRDCIPQPDTATKVDILSYRQRLVSRLVYRNLGTHESLVAYQSVEAATGIAGIRWYEVRDPNGTPTIHQQGTYVPGISDGIHRWNGSVGMDGSGNIALGYSASNSSTVYPSVWYSGRLASDPLGTLPQGEEVVIDGTGSATSSARWGDDSSMTVDPADDCTFWYVNQYMPTTSSVGWQLRVGTFRFPSCVPPGGIFLDGFESGDTTRWSNSQP